MIISFLYSFWFHEEMLVKEWLCRAPSTLWHAETTRCRNSCRIWSVGDSLPYCSHYWCTEYDRSMSGLVIRRKVDCFSAFWLSSSVAYRKCSTTFSMLLWYETALIHADLCSSIVTGFEPQTVTFHSSSSTASMGYSMIVVPKTSLIGTSSDTLYNISMSTLSLNVYV